MISQNNQIRKLKKELEHRNNHSPELDTMTNNKSNIKEVRFI